MKKLVLFSAILLLGLSGSAQFTDYNKIIPGEESRPKTFEDYLVQLAWNNSPQGKALGNRQRIAQLETNLTQREWMDNLQVQWNLNEISLSNIIYPDNELFVALPIWNVTATVDLGTVANRKKKIEINKQKEEITQQNINLLKLQMRAKVLESYEQYLLAIEILKVRTEAEQFSNETRTLLRELFKENKAEFEDMSRAADAYAKAKEGRIQAESDIRKTKYALEELIGITYEEAEKFGASYKK